MTLLRPQPILARLNRFSRGISISSSPYLIDKIDFWPIDVPVTDPFTVASGTRVMAENIIVRVTLKNGAAGYGEAAPFPEISGEDRVSCCASILALGEAILGQSVTEYRRIAGLLKDIDPGNPAARCSLETALLDAFCHAAHIPLWALWGGADPRPRTTDITIPITDLERTVELAQTWYREGFRVFKMKVGNDPDEDVRKIEVVHKACPGAAFIADGNQGYTRSECEKFVDGVKNVGAGLVLLEQPVIRKDLDAMAALRATTGIPIAADESVRTLSDAEEVIRKKAADCINIKIMKTGVVESVDIATFTQASGIKLMIGGMVETRLAMGCSFSLVLGLGGFDLLDLDTPLLLASDPIAGGFSYDGPNLSPWDGDGLEMEHHPTFAITTISQ